MATLRVHLLGDSKEHRLDAEEGGLGTEKGRQGAECHAMTSLVPQPRPAPPPQKPRAPYLVLLLVDELRNRPVELLLDTGSERKTWRKGLGHTYQAQDLSPLTGARPLNHVWQRRVPTYQVVHHFRWWQLRDGGCSFRAHASSCFGRPGLGTAGPEALARWRALVKATPATSRLDGQRG